MDSAPYQWWQTGVVYQIYPRSFMDANDDGTGDLAGIQQRLDYLQWLGVDALWLSPIYPSPMADFGYDVANYVDIDPLFGDLSDFDHLLAEVHRRGMRLLLDFVPNHTSDQHPWFVASRASRENPRRDWYIWRDPKPNGGPPNNWTSFFGGDAWTLDPATGQYYLHLFDFRQPDLNWRHPEVRATMYDAMRFWMERGVDGFRVDVMWLMVKDAQLRDNPPTPGWKLGDPLGTRQVMRYSADQPETHQIVREMRALLDSYGERVLIGEIYLPLPRLLTYYGDQLDEAHLPFNFRLVRLPWQAAVMRQAVEDYEAALPPGAWPNWVLSNHDNSRIASRIGPAQARVAQMLLLTLRGTPTCYYGDELGMRDGIIPPELEVDPLAKLSPGYGRDPERTPMQWDASPNAGFSRATPWLPVGEEYPTVNVEAERSDPRSTLTLIRQLLALRRSLPALTVGSYRTVFVAGGDLFLYLREADGQGMLVALNFGSAPRAVDASAVGSQGTVLLSTHLDREGVTDLTDLELRGDEGLVVRID